MRLKSKYRAFRDGGRVDELPVEPVSAAPEVPPLPAELPAEPPQSSPPASDDATAALRAQIDRLRQSESLRQQQQQQMHDAMHAAKGQRDAWLESTPGAKQNIEALGHFHHAAIHGGLIDASPEYFRFLEDQLAAFQQQQEPAMPHAMVVCLRVTLVSFRKMRDDALGEVGQPDRAALGDLLRRQPRRRDGIFGIGAHGLASSESRR